MGLTAFVFSGNGDQHPGMGSELVDQYKEAAIFFKIFDRIRPGTTGQCFFSHTGDLDKQRNAQPCLFALEYVIASILRSGGIVPNAVAGFSIGELTACTLAGMFSPEDGFRLAVKRGELMDAAAGRKRYFEAVIIGLKTDLVTMLCQLIPDVHPIYYCCSGQVTVSGKMEQFHLLSQIVRVTGGHILRLNENAGFHTPIMNEASEEFYKELLKIRFYKPELKVYSNMTTVPYEECSQELLANQIKSPVQWETMIENMISDGIDTFVEIGPGDTLTKLIKKINKSVITHNTLDVAETLREIRHI